MNPNSYNNFPQGFPSSLNIGFIDYQSRGTLINGIQANSPMFNNSSNALDNVTLQNVLQDGGLSNVSFNTVQANVIKGGKLIGASLQVGTTFSVDSTGFLTATNADITGNITATTINASSGTIGGWTLSSNSFSSAGMVISSSTGINFNAGVFEVTSAGALTATNATITGNITGSTITGGSINIGSGYFQVLSNGEVLFNPPASQNDAVFFQNASIAVFQDQFNSIICDLYAYGAKMNINAGNQELFIFAAGFSLVFQSALLAVGTNFQVAGNFTATGTKSAIESTSEGDVLLYSVESPEVIYEDFGTIRIQNGEAEIPIENLFLEVTHAEEEIKAFLTGRGKYSYLYWEKSSDKSFKVFCDKDIEVDWMVVANRRGYNNKSHRFKKTKKGNTDPIDQSYRQK